MKRHQDSSKVSWLEELEAADPPPRFRAPRQLLIRHQKKTPRTSPPLPRIPYRWRDHLPKSWKLIHGQRVLVTICPLREAAGHKPIRVKPQILALVEAHRFHGFLSAQEGGEPQSQ